jgi:CBS domain-containing protein
MPSSLKAVLDKKGHQVYSIDPLASVMRAVETMNDKRVGALLILADNAPIGIFTERDILVRVLAEGRDPATTRVAEAMTSDLVVVASSTTVEEAMAICTQKRCRHLPVMDGDEVLGLVSSGDLTQWVAQRQSTEIEDLIRYIRGGYRG